MQILKIYGLLSITTVGGVLIEGCCDLSPNLCHNPPVIMPIDREAHCRKIRSRAMLVLSASVFEMNKIFFGYFDPDFFSRQLEELIFGVT